MHTWRELITTTLRMNNENWGNVEYTHLTEEQLEMSCDPLDEDHYCVGPAEVAYTEDYVYVVTFDFDYNLYFINPYLRNPPAGD